MIRVLPHLKKYADHVTFTSNAHRPCGWSHLLQYLTIGPFDVKCILCGNVESTQNLGCLWKPQFPREANMLLGDSVVQTGSSISQIQVSFAPFHFLLCLQGVSISLLFRQQDMETASRLQYLEDSTGPSHKQVVQKQKHKAP